MQLWFDLACLQDDEELRLQRVLALCRAVARAHPAAQSTRSAREAEHAQQEHTSAADLHRQAPDTGAFHSCVVLLRT